MTNSQIINQCYKIRTKARETFIISLFIFVFEAFSSTKNKEIQKKNQRS